MADQPPPATVDGAAAMARLVRIDELRRRGVRSLHPGEVAELRQLVAGGG